MTYDVEKFREAFEYQFTWLNGFLRNARRFCDSAALYDPDIDQRWTYEDLNVEANRLAHALLRDGVHKNSIVMYMLFNSPEFVFCYIASHKTGAISCPVNFRLSPGELAQQIDDSRPDIFIYDETFGESARKALKLAQYKPKRIVITDRTAASNPFWQYMADMPATDPDLPDRQHIYTETTRLYTSGTTHIPKAVPLNSINEVLSSHDVIMHFPLNPTDRTMNMTPWFHRGGLHSGGPTPTLYAGGEVIILREFNPRRCLNIAEKEKVTFLIGVPSILALLARAQEHQPADLSALRGIVTMGSPFDKNACERYRKLLSPNIFNGYGTTETFWNTFLRPYNLPDMAGSAGQACTDDDVRVVRLRDDNSRSEPDELAAKDNVEVGEIIISSPAKSTGSYVNNPQMTEHKFYKGFHYTGDLGTWNKNEFITVVSRKDDMIICSGENIYPSQIEAVLNEHPAVAECAVIGVPDKRHGQAICAYIVPQDKNLTADELKEFVRNHHMLASYQHPRHYKFVDKLPHTATGKLKHYALRQQVKADE